MKKYQLKSENSTLDGRAVQPKTLAKIGSIKFTYDKAFFRTKFDNTPKYVAHRISINIYFGSSPDKELEMISKNYKNPRDFEIILDQKEKS